MKYKTVASVRNWIALTAVLARLVLCIVLSFSASAWAQNASPTVTVTGPANGATYIAPDTIHLEATAPDGDSPVSYVNFYANGSYIWSGYGWGGGIYKLDWNSTVPGTYAITATAYYQNGTTTTSAPITLEVKQNKLPAITMASPADTSEFVAPGSFWLSAVASDTDGTISNVEFWANGVKWSDSWDQGNGLFNTHWDNVPVGTYQVTAKAFDNKNGSTMSSPITIVVKPNSLPTVTMTGPANNSHYVAPGNFWVSAIASDTDGTIASVNFYANGVLASGSWGQGNGLYNMHWETIPPGTYQITAVATDDKGGQRVSDPITIVVSPNSPPIVSMLAPANNTRLVAPATITTVAKATDSDGTIQYVQYLINGTEWTDSTDQGLGIFSKTFPNVPAGTYTFAARATDDKGGQTLSAPVTVTVYATPPPTISVTSPVDKRLYTPGAGIPLQAAASDNGSVTQVEFFSGATSLGTAALSSGNASSGAWVNNTWAGVAAGTYSITARATDNNGNTVTSDPVSVIVSASSPITVNIASPAGTGYAAPASVPLTATASSTNSGIDSVQFFAGATPIGLGYLASGTVSSGAYVTNAWTNVPAGTYSITAMATDAAGYSTVSTPVSYTVGAATSGATTLYFINADHLNTPRLVENQVQQAVWKWEQSEAFGDSIPNENPSGLGAFTFALRFGAVTYYDQETHTLQNTYRDLDLRSGKYLQSDPIGLEGGINTFGYVSSNPLRGIDRFGLFDWPEMPPQLNAGSTSRIAGFGDVLISIASVGFVSGADLRAKFDIGSVDMCSSNYEKGKWAGYAVAAVTMAAPGLRAIAARQAARKGLRQTGGGGAGDSAEALYDLIRRSRTDVETIAANTGIKPGNIQKVKDHVFYNEHLLDRYVGQGVPAVLGRFDSSLPQALAWQRLERGTFSGQDITWLKHETAERWYELTHGSGYSRAHNAAQGKWSGYPWE